MGDDAAWRCRRSQGSSDGQRCHTVVEIRLISRIVPTSTGQAPARALTRCAICERLADVAFEYMAQAQGELATGRERQAEHARSGGFCPTHTWQYAEIASDLGIAQGYAELTEAAADRLRAAEQDASTEDELQAALAQLLPGPERCPACVALAEAERAAVRELLAPISTQRIDPWFQASS
jgi:plasmid stability protein